MLLDVQRLFHSFEKRLSRFDPDSELSRFNTRQADVFKASLTLLDAVEAALWAAQTTAGLYDPTIIGALERAGYDRSFEKIGQSEGHVNKIARSLPQSYPRGRGNFTSLSLERNEGGTTEPNNCTFRSIHLNRAWREIYKPRGLRLDLGGIGKGWTVDRVADRLQGLGPFLLNAGGDIFAYQSPPGQKGWSIDLIHPLKSDLLMAKLKLHHRALATSTIAKRRWQRHGRIMHHLIDPRTGQPAQTDVVSVSVIAHRTMMAEVYAKVALILGMMDGLAYLNRLPGVEGLIFTKAGEIQYTNGFEELLIRLEPSGYAKE